MEQVCCLDGHIYHGSCLGYDIDTCNHIRNTPDWFCNSCMGTCLPFFNNFLNHEPKNKITCLCEFCKSNRRDLNEIFNLFDIFNGDENINEFDDSMCDTLSLASNVLSNCSYKNVNEIVNADELYATLYFQNIDGYKSKFEETMYNINSLRSSPSFIAFCETSFKESDINYYEISGYNSEHLYGINNKSKGSGISLYFKKSLLFNRIASLNIRNEHFECMGGRFNTHNNKFYIIVVYRFHYKDNEFSTEFNKVLKDYKNKPLIVMGDFNINLLNYDSNKTVDDFVNDMFSNSFYPLINKPTNFFQNNSTLIDQAWSNMRHENTNCSTTVYRSLVRSTCILINQKFQYYKM